MTKELNNAIQESDDIFQNNCLNINNFNFKYNNMNKFLKKRI